jgi:hypothetical protein
MMVVVGILLQLLARIVFWIIISKASGWGAEKIREAMTLCLLIMTRISACLMDDLTVLIVQHDAVTACPSTSRLGQ